MHKVLIVAVALTLILIERPADAGEVVSAPAEHWRFTIPDPQTFWVYGPSMGNGSIKIVNYPPSSDLPGELLPANKAAIVVFELPTATDEFSKVASDSTGSSNVWLSLRLDGPPARGHFTRPILGSTSYRVKTVSKRIATRLFQAQLTFHPGDPNESQYDSVLDSVVSSLAID